MNFRSSSLFALLAALVLTLSACDTTGSVQENPPDGRSLFASAEVATSRGADAATQRFNAHAVRIAAEAGANSSLQSEAQDSLKLTVIATAKLADADFSAENAGVTNVKFATVPSSNAKMRHNSEDGEFNGVVATLVTPGADYYGGVFYVGLDEKSFTDGKGLVSDCFEFAASDLLDDEFYLTGALSLEALQEGGTCEGAGGIDPAALRGPGAVLRVQRDGTLADTTSSASRTGLQLEARGGRLFTAFGTVPENDGGGFENEYGTELSSLVQRTMPSPVLGQDAYDTGGLRVASFTADGHLNDYASGASSPDVSFDTGLDLNILERADIDHYRKAGTDFYAVSGQDGKGRIYDAEGNELYTTPGGYIVSTDMAQDWVAFAGDGLVYLLEFKDDGTFGELYQINGAREDESFPYASSVRVVDDLLIVGADDGVYLLRLEKQE